MKLLIFTKTVPISIEVYLKVTGNVLMAKVFVSRIAQKVTGGGVFG